MMTIINFSIELQQINNFQRIKKHLIESKLCTSNYYKEITFNRIDYGNKLLHYPSKISYSAIRNNYHFTCELKEECLMSHDGKVVKLFHEIGNLRLATIDLSIFHDIVGVNEIGLFLHQIITSPLVKNCNYSLLIIHDIQYLARTNTLSLHVKTQKNHDTHLIDEFWIKVGESLTRDNFSLPTQNNMDYSLGLLG